MAPPAVDTPSLLHGNGARLTWRRAPESDFLRYEVHRSTTSGFAAPSAATKLVEIGYRPLTMYTDTTAKGGTTYHYKDRHGGDVRPSREPGERPGLPASGDQQAGRARYI